MFTETLTAHDDVVGIACNGKLSEDDIQRMHALLHERLRVANKPGIVINLVGFEGHAGIEALREDIKMDTSHRNEFGRVAVVGERKWIKWGTSLAGLLTSSEMRYFDTSDADAAVDWVRQV